PTAFGVRAEGSDVSEPPSRSQKPPSGTETAAHMLLAQLGAVRAELERLRTREKLALRRAGEADRLAQELRDAQRTLDGINRSITFSRSGTQTGMRWCSPREVLPNEFPKIRVSALQVRKAGWTPSTPQSSTARLVSSFS